MSELRAWDEWLGRPECVMMLEKVARSVIRQARRVELPDSLLPCGLPRSASPADTEECALALANDLWVFLRTRPDAWKERTSLEWLSAQGERFLVHKIAQDYLLHLKDQARTFGLNPWRAMYRRIRQVLREEKSVHYRADFRGAFYSLEEDAPELNHRMSSLAPPYEQWESPLSIAEAGGLHRKEDLLRLARHFWVQAAEHLGGKGRWLPVRELVSYLSRHYSDLGDPVFESLSSCPTPDDASLLDAVEARGVEPAPEHSLVRERLPQLARNLAASWTEKQRTAFSLVQGEGRTLEAAAACMGYKGASGVSHVHRTALDRLRDFCLLWPGLSPPDLNEDLFDEFVEQILAVCKRGV